MAEEIARRLRTQADDPHLVDEHGNRVDDCGHCTLLPSLRGYVRATQVDCPEHGGRAVAAAANLPRRLRTQAERDADGTTWRPGGVVNGDPGHVELDDDECVLVVREGVGVMCVRATHQHDPNPVLDDLARRRWWHRYTRRTR